MYHHFFWCAFGNLLIATISLLVQCIKSGVAQLRLTSRMRLFEPFHAALWAFRTIIHLFLIFYFYCKV